MAKYNWNDTKKGFKTLLNRNAIVAVIFNIFYQYSTLMKNATRSSIVRLTVGLAPSYVAVCGTIFSLVAFVFRVPVGAFIDKHREQLKKALIIMNVARALVYVFGYGMASSQIWITAAYIVDGVVFCFCAVAGPALMAVSVDQKAMGSAYAIYMGLANMLTGSAKSFGLSLYNNYGALISNSVAGGFALASAVVVCFLNADTLCDTLRKEQAERVAKGLDAIPKRDGFLNKLAGFSLLALPFAIVTGLISIEGSVSSGYLPLLAKELSFDYLGAQTFCNTLNGALTIVVGILADFISPNVLIIIGLIAKVAGNYFIATAATNDLFVAGFCMITITQFVTHTLRICAMKILPYSEQGALSSTIYVVQDLAMLVGILPGGFLADHYGYASAFLLNSAFCAAGLLVFLFVLINSKRNKQTKTDIVS